MLKKRRLFVLLLVSAGLAACATSRPKTVQFAESVPTKSEQDFANWPIEPLAAERLMSGAEYEILSVKSIGSGTTRPEIVKIRFPGTGEGNPQQGIRPRNSERISNRTGLQGEKPDRQRPGLAGADGIG